MRLLLSDYQRVGYANIIFDQITHVIFILEDGAKLEDGNGASKVYLNGVYDANDIHGSSITLLMPDTAFVSDMVYICTISFKGKRPGIETISKDLPVSTKGGVIMPSYNMYLCKS